MVDLIYSPSSLGLVQEAAAQWLQRLQQRPPHEPYGVALSGGRLARSFFEAVTFQVQSTRVDWSNVHFFWADERCVPPDDPENNFSIAHAALFTPCQIPSGQVHRIKGEAGPAYAASEAEAEICRVLPLTNDGQPFLNIAFLGMGEDGHIASLFPGEPESFTTDARVYRPVVASKPPPHRITIGYQPLLNASDVWVLCSGTAKHSALSSACHGRDDLPITRLVRARSQTRIFQDIAPSF